MLLIFCINCTVQNTTWTCTEKNDKFKPVYLQNSSWSLKLIISHCKCAILRKTHLCPITNRIMIPFSVSNLFNSSPRRRLSKKFISASTNYWHQKLVKVLNWTLRHPCFSDWVPSLSAAECCNDSHNKENLWPFLQEITSLFCNHRRSFLTVSFRSSSCS